MILHSTTPPAGGPTWAVGPGITITEGPPRELHGLSVEELHDAMAECAVKVFGASWRTPLERVADLRPGNTAKWQRAGQIPPPRIVAWLAWAAQMDEPRQIGAAIVASMDGVEDTHLATARTALELI